MPRFVFDLLFEGGVGGGGNSVSGRTIEAAHSQQAQFLIGQLYPGARIVRFQEEWESSYAQPSPSEAYQDFQPQDAPAKLEAKYRGDLISAFVEVVQLLIIIAGFGTLLALAGLAVLEGLGTFDFTSWTFKFSL